MNFKKFYLFNSELKIFLNLFIINHCKKIIKSFLIKKTLTRRIYLTSTYIFYDKNKNLFTQSLIQSFFSSQIKRRRDTWHHFYTFFVNVKFSKIELSIPGYILCVSFQCDSPSEKFYIDNEREVTHRVSRQHLYIIGRWLVMKKHVMLAQLRNKKKKIVNLWVVHFPNVRCVHRNLEKPRRNLYISC